MRLNKYLAETAQCTSGSEAKPAGKGAQGGKRRGVQKRDTQLKDNDTVTVDGRAAALSEVRLPHAQQARGGGERLYR